MLSNKDIRKAIDNAGVRYWQVAFYAGMADTSFSRLLRFELEKNKKEKIFKAIEKAKEVYGK